jgi:hypothetical protein
MHTRQHVGTSVKRGYCCISWPFLFDTKVLLHKLVGPFFIKFENYISMFQKNHRYSQYYKRAK